MKNLNIIRDQFEELTANNDHTEAAQLLVWHFGTDAEKMKMAAIKARHYRHGYISVTDQVERDLMLSKYHRMLPPRQPATRGYLGRRTKCSGTIEVVEAVLLPPVYAM